MFAVGDYKSLHAASATTPIDSEMKSTPSTVCSESASSPAVAAAAAASSATETKAAFLTDSNFENSFRSANTDAWQKITNDPLLTLPKSQNSAAVVEYAKRIQNYKDNLNNCNPLLYEAVRAVFVNRSFIDHSV